MTDRTEWWPSSRQGDYARWDLPVEGWSGAEYGDDAIKLQVQDGHWYACTEFDQNVHRDLDDAEIASIRAEFNLCGIPAGA